MFELWDWNVTVWHFSLGRLVLALFIFLLALLFSKLFVRLLLKMLAAQTTVDDKIFVTLESPLKFSFLVVAFYLATWVLNVPADIDGILTPLIRSLLVFGIFWTLYRCVEPLSFIIDKVTIALGVELTHGLKNLLIKALKLLILLIGLTAFLNEWGINVLALLAGFSIAGVAVAFAAKESIANIFGSLTIIFDNMFKQGDWIMTPDVEGTVEEIGSRSTKIRTFAKALVTVPNATLANSMVMNWSRVTNRRIKMRIALEYRTSREQITRIIQRIEDYLQNHPEIETDSSKAAMLVHLVEFNDSSIDILLYYFTKTTLWLKWIRIREENMLFFMKIIEEEGAAFAFPSQQIYLEKLPSDLPKLM
jgi:MscS family membrane protein